MIDCEPKPKELVDSILNYELNRLSDITDFLSENVAHDIGLPLRHTRFHSGYNLLPSHHNASSLKQFNPTISQKRKVTKIIFPSATVADGAHPLSPLSCKRQKAMSYCLPGWQGHRIGRNPAFPCLLFSLQPVRSWGPRHSGTTQIRSCIISSLSVHFSVGEKNGWWEESRS